MMIDLMRQLDYYICKLIDKLGYDYLLKENGKNLSGGEKLKTRIGQNN